jgi:hypothetical protein
MFRVQQPNNEYRNLELSEAEFLALATGASTALGLAVWSQDTHEYVNTLTADAVPLAYVAWNRDNLP